MKTQNPKNTRRRRNGVRCLSRMTMRQARMVLVANALVGWQNPDGTTCAPWPDREESSLAAKMLCEAAIKTAENTVIAS